VYQILRKSVTKNVWNCVSCVSRKLLAELPFAESFETDTPDAMDLSAVGTGGNIAK
jgi:hypothetical protein